MICVYETVMTCNCPVDGSKDLYVVALESDHMIKVEDIIAELKRFETMEDFQEGVTDVLSRTFDCQVTTIGTHSGIKVTVVSK